MKERLLEFLRARVSLRREDEDLVCSGFFVARGCLRSFWIDESGKEQNHVAQAGNYRCRDRTLGARVGSLRR